MLLAAAATSVTLLAALRPVAAQSALPDSMMARPVLLMRAVPDGLGKPATAPTRRVARMQWEHGALTVGNGGNWFRWAGPDNTLVESRNPIEFLTRLGADPQIRLRSGRQVDEVQAAILGELGRQQWELVSCQHVRDDSLTLCYLKRPVDVTP